MSGSNPGTWRPTLESAVQMSPDGPPPTITADEYRGKGRKAAWHAEQEGNSFYRDGKKVQLGLEQAVRIWTTQTSSPWQSGTGTQAREGHAPPLTDQVQGQLNPAWVETYLMAWPQGWTDGDGPLNHPTYRAWQQVFRTALIAYVPSAMDGYHCVQQ